MSPAALQAVCNCQIKYSVSDMHLCINFAEQDFVMS